MSNPEQFHEELADINEPQEKGPGLELAHGPELDELANAASNLAGKIEGDKDVYEKDLDRLREALENMKVDIGGEMMTVEEVKKIPDLQKNIKLWKEIKAKMYDYSSELTFLTNQAAEDLSHYRGILYLDHLSSISDQVAEHLSNYKGTLHLGGLLSISDKTAEHLIKFNGDLFLEGLASLSDHAAESLAKHQNHHLFLSSNIRRKVDKFRQKK